jgi:hypothetical protein
MVVDQMEDDMEEFSLFFDELNLCCDPPPLFDLPAPPPPPFLDTPLLPSCGSSSLPVVSSMDSLQDIFHSIIIITVSSLVIVISLIFAAAFIWRYEDFLQ